MGLVQRTWAGRTDASCGHLLPLALMPAALRLLLSWALLPALLALLEHLLPPCRCLLALPALLLLQAQHALGHGGGRQAELARRPGEAALARRLGEGLQQAD